MTARVGLSPRGWAILTAGLAAVGYALLARVLLVEGIQDAGGLGGIDAIAYWRAADRLFHGQPLYVAPSFEFASYQYPPPFAQLLTPVALLPMPVFVWAWRAVELVCLRVATGGWVRAGIALLVFPPVIAELDAGNVHLVMAAVVTLTMRGVTSLPGPAFLLKFATWPLLPAAIRINPTRAAAGVAIALGVVATSWLLAPEAWRSFTGLLAATSAPTGWYNLMTGIPPILRLGAAGLVGLAAIRWRRLGALAVLLAYPVVWFHSLSTLVAAVAPTPRPMEGSGSDDVAGARPAGAPS